MLNTEKGGPDGIKGLAKGCPLRERLIANPLRSGSPTRSAVKGTKNSMGPTFPLGFNDRKPPAGDARKSLVCVYERKGEDAFGNSLKKALRRAALCSRPATKTHFTNKCSFRKKQYSWLLQVICQACHLRATEGLWLIAKAEGRPLAPNWGWRRAGPPEAYTQSLQKLW